MSRRRTSKLKFTGELAKPLGFKHRQKTVLASLDDITRSLPRKLVVSLPAGVGKTGHTSRIIADLMQKASDRSEKIDRRLELLLQTLNIPNGPEQWKMLATRLAEEFVPGFRVIHQPGAPQRWTLSALASLRSEVDEIAAGGCTAMEACRRLLRNSDGSMRYRGCNSVRTLYRRYQESKKVLR